MVNWDLLELNLQDGRFYQCSAWIGYRKAMQNIIRIVELINRIVQIRGVKRKKNKISVKKTRISGHLDIRKHSDIRTSGDSENSDIITSGFGISGTF